MSNNPKKNQISSANPSIRGPLTWQGGRWVSLNQSTYSMATVESDCAFILTYALNNGVPIEYEPFDEDEGLDWDVDQNEEE